MKVRLELNMRITIPAARQFPMTDLLIGRSSACPAHSHHMTADTAEFFPEARQVHLDGDVGGVLQPLDQDWHLAEKHLSDPGLHGLLDLCPKPVNWTIRIGSAGSPDLVAELDVGSSA